MTNDARRRPLSGRLSTAMAAISGVLLAAGMAAAAPAAAASPHTPRQRDDCRDGSGSACGTGGRGARAGDCL